jgi:PHD/YefM family antitoxin component YafN of YafNO toxin-antitoxin module
MIITHPTILEKDGQRAFVVLPYDEFVMLEEELQEFEDLKQLRAAKAEEAASPAIPLSELKELL